MPKPYQPSSGTEGACFFEAWCSHCQHDKAMSEGAPIEDCDDNQVCRIIGDTFAYEIDDPKYPKEWIYDEDGNPRCTKFLHVNDEPERERCQFTIDMFP